MIIFKTHLLGSTTKDVIEYFVIQCFDKKDIITTCYWNAWNIASFPPFSCIWAQYSTLVILISLMFFLVYFNALENIIDSSWVTDVLIEILMYLNRAYLAIDKYTCQPKYLSVKILVNKSTCQQTYLWSKVLVSKVLVQNTCQQKCLSAKILVNKDVCKKKSCSQKYLSSSPQIPKFPGLRGHSFLWKKHQWSQISGLQINKRNQFC